MTRRPAPISYSASLEVPALPTIATHSLRVPAQDPAAETAIRPSGTGQGRGRRPLEDAADPSVLYLHPVGKKALAVERGVKVHDLLLEAVEQWAAAHGLAGPWRVPSAAPPRRQRGLPAGKN
jgi:hypothetical protein